MLAKAQNMKMEVLPGIFIMASDACMCKSYCFLVVGPVFPFGPKPL